MWVNWLIKQLVNWTVMEPGGCFVWLESVVE
jgi:hypothetical protein